MVQLLIGVGLFFVIEGLVYSLAPGLLRRAAEQLPKISDGHLRVSGVAAIAIGVAIVWLARHAGG